MAALVLGNSFALACEPSSPEMSRFLNQKNWKSYQLHDESSLAPVNGYTDGQGRFYFDDMTRGGSFSAQLTIDPNNQSYKEFFSYCRNPDKKGAYLRSMRRNGENNHYQVSVRYLPKFNGLTNDPFADQAFHVTDVDLSLKFDSTSIMRTQEYFPGSTITQVTNLLLAQAKGQKEFGVFTLDLTGWDDVVCDLVQGRATLTIKKAASSSAPLVQQNRVLDPEDIATLARALKSRQQRPLSKEQAIYLAARTQAKLESDHQIKTNDDKLSFKIVQSVMDPTMTQFLNPNADDLICASDRLQSYTQNVVPQLFSIGVKLPSMDELNP